MVDSTAHLDLIDAAAGAERRPIRVCIEIDLAYWIAGGRLKVEDAVDPTVGFVISVKPGDKVLAGEPIASVYGRDAAGVELACQALGRAIVIADRLTEKPLPLVSHRVTKAGVEELGSTRPRRGPTPRAAPRD